MNRRILCLLASAAVAAASCGDGDDGPEVLKPAVPEAKICQIPDGGVIARSHDALDFACGCTRIDGILAIEGAGLLDLHCLRDAKEITGTLALQNPIDSDVELPLDALEHLQRVGTLWLAGLPLSDLTLFASLESADVITLNGMNQLRDLHGLERAVWRELKLTNNDALQSLDGLAAPEEAASITLQNNPALERLDALADGWPIDRLQIVQCDALTGLRGVRADILGLRLEKNARLRSLDGFSGLPNGADVSLDALPELESIDGLFRKEQPVIYRLQLFSLPKLSRIDLRSATMLGVLVAQGCPALEEIRGVESIETMAQLHFTGLNAMAHLPSFDALHSVRDLELIDMPGLTDLAQLSALTSVENASLSFMDALTSLHGLEQLATGKRILLEDLLGLETLEGLRGLETVDTLWLQGDDELQTLAGLTLKRAGELAIRFNDELRSLEGLEMLGDVGTLDVSQNASLASVRGLAGLQRSAEVYVRANPQLAQCELDWLSKVLPAGSMQKLEAGSDVSSDAECR